MAAWDAIWRAVFVAAVLLFAIVATRAVVTEGWQNEAVKVGHAEFYLDKEHQRQWRWLPTEPGNGGRGNPAPERSQ